MSANATQKKPVIDRRSARTRRLLHQALLSLILENDYEAITVQDIIDRADVGRATFYAHYAGKDDLLRKGFEKLRAEIQDARQGTLRMPQEETRLSFTSVIFEHAERHKLIYRALIGGRANSIALREFRRLIFDAVRAEVSGCDNPDVSRDLLAHFTVDAIQSVVVWWLERHAELPCATIDQMFKELVTPALTRGCRKERPFAA